MLRIFILGAVAILLVLPSGAQEQQQAPAAQTGEPSNAAPGPEPAQAAPKTRRKRKHRKSQRSGPKKVVVPNGSTSEAGGQLSPGLSDTEAQRQRQTTEQLLRDSQANLKAATARQLSTEQQDTARQITAYMQQAQSASEDGDLERAHNLALKARLLSDTLARR